MDAGNFASNQKQTERAEPLVLDTEFATNVNSLERTEVTNDGKVVFVAGITNWLSDAFGDTGGSGGFWNSAGGDDDDIHMAASNGHGSDAKHH